MGYSTCGGYSGRERHGRTCDGCDRCKVCDQLPNRRITVSGYGLAGYYCAECAPKAREAARESIARYGFAEAFR